ncbi:MAG: sulfite exporter TauE/SafE family protein [Bacteroidia bacterium]|nr:sulfite exporter TauE/SafE family protein [Bacteroidia bacterium]
MTLSDWLLFAFCAMLSGMSKTGVAGIYYLTVPIMAAIFGGKVSTGVLLPILNIADFFAVWYYKRSANWTYIIRLVPVAFLGVILGTWVGNMISEEGFKLIMGIVVLFGIGVMVFMDLRKTTDVPDYWWFSLLTGLISGFSTMVGNAAGSVLAVYLLSMRLPKDVYIGTTAWFFLIINLTKVPFHVFVWKTITWNSFLMGMAMIPVVGLGAVLGIWIVRQIPDKYYRGFVLVVTAASAIFLLL